MLAGQDIAMASPSQVAAASAEEYSLLEPHPDNWRKQLWLKGRTMTVGQLVYSMRASGMLDDPDAAARNFAVPVEQVRQALRYYERHRALIEDEADEEKRRIEARGFVIERRQ